MSQALYGLRAMVSPPKYSLPIPHPPDGRPRLDGVIGWSRIRAVAGGRRRWATEPQQIPSAGTWIWSSISGASTWPICSATPAVAGARLQGEGSRPARDPH
jgi:hypothetical protein